MKILNIEPDTYSPQAKSILQSLGDYSEQKPSNIKELSSYLPEVDILISRLQFRLDATSLESAKNLKIIGTATTGLNHIDLDFCRSKNIKVVSLFGETDFLRKIPATAELTWGLLLSLVRKIPWAIQSTHSGQWQRDEFRGVDLADKTLGILGLGRIGQMIAQFGAAFKMKVQAYDPYLKEWPASVKRVETLDHFFQSSQILSIHLPLNSETEKIVGEKELSKLPRGAILLNTSRGRILDEAALLKALESRHLAGAALDVLSDELLPERKIFERLRTYASAHQNLILTPHIGGASFDSMAQTEIFIAEKIKTLIA